MPVSINPLHNPNPITDPQNPSQVSAAQEMAQAMQHMRPGGDPLALRQHLHNVVDHLTQTHIDHVTAEKNKYAQIDAIKSDINANHGSLRAARTAVANAMRGKRRAK